MQGAPHVFVDTTFGKLTYCASCKQLLWGLRNQGRQCRICSLPVHRKCQASLQAAGGCKPAVAGRQEAPPEPSLERSGEDLSSSSGAQTHDFVLTTFTSPAFCSVCHAFLWGIAKQGLKCSCCKRIVHRKCMRRAKRCEDAVGPEDVGGGGQGGRGGGVVLDNELIEALRQEGHSAGGVVECMYSLLDAGLPVTRAAVEQCLRARAQRGQVSEEEDGDDGDATLCCICMERPRNALVLPCKHLCLCTPCSDVPSCPICRAPAQQVISGIFL